MNPYLITATCLTLSSPALTQTALVREGDPAPNGAPGDLVIRFGSTAVNSGGGFGVSLASGTGFDIKALWGSLSPGAGALLREGEILGGATQQFFDSTLGLSSTDEAYVASVDLASGGTGIESAWLGDVPLGFVGDMIPGTADFWTFFTDPGVTDDGVPYFVAGIEDAQGVPLGRGLFMGVVPTAVFKSGDTVPNMPAPLSSSAVDFDFKFSPDGSRSIVELDLALSGTEDRVMSLDGVGLILGGTLAQEDQPIPASVGGVAGENWDNFDFYDINNSGDYVFTGDTNGDDASDEFIVRDGLIWHREGDMIDGELVVDSIEGATINANGNIAYIWDVVDGAGTSEALFLNEELILKAGDAVDWDGDGVIDPTVTVESFEGANTMTLSDAGTVYFIATVDVAGSSREGYFEMSTIIATNFCSANVNSTGVAAAISALGSGSVAVNNLQLTCSSMPTFSFGLFILSQDQDFVMNPGGSEGNLCLSGSIGRFQQQIMSSGSTGSISISVDLTALPQPMGAVAALPGDAWSFQTWFRDTNTMGVASSNFSDGLEIVFD